MVSVITVEYDIREDQPEGTEVFELKASSNELIEKLVTKRFPQLSQVDVRTVAEFSGGNARIAIALSETVGRGESFAGMSDEDLFNRLFQQRHEPSESLLQAAQALSLTYSFQGEDVSNGEEAELFRFGALIGKNAQEMFQSADELRRRGLVQQRGIWRAILPQAIANRLAAGALKKIPPRMIEEQLISGAPARMMRSFSRRLGYLDSSPTAKSIVTRWLDSGGMLGNVAELTDLGSAMLSNIAPVAPEAALSAIERTFLERKSDEFLTECARYTVLLRSLAYDAVLFERCVASILMIAEAQGIDKDVNDASKVFASLFPIYFSGTHATIDQRLEIIKSLLLSESPKKRTLGLMALKAVLEAWQFGPGYNFEFGARSRDYGYSPRSKEDVKQWFEKALTLAETFSTSSDPSAAELRKLLADRFRGLWTKAEACDSLERVCRSISKGRFWVEAWIAIRQTIYYDSKGLSTESSRRLAALEEFMRPIDVVQRVRSIVLSEALTYVGVDSTHDGTKDIEKTNLQVESAARDLGKIVATDQEAFAKLMPELITGKSQQIWSFGAGVAESGADPGTAWAHMTERLATIPAEKQNPQLFRGFLNALYAKDSKLGNSFLDDAVENDSLAPWFPVLQTVVGIDKKGVSRLLRSLDLGKAWIGIYRNLVLGRVTHQICGSDFKDLLLRIAEKPGGIDIAIEIFYQRLGSDSGLENISKVEVIDLGCQLMLQLPFGQRNSIDNYRLGIVGRACLVGERGETTVREICRKLKDAISKSETSAYYQEELLQVLFRAQPLAALNALCGENAEDLKVGIRIMEEAGQFRANPFDSIPEKDLLNWCAQQPETRYAAVAGGVSALKSFSEPGRVQWTDTALSLLDRAPNRVEVLKGLMRQLRPFGLSGSRASIVEANSKLLDELAQHSDPAVREFVAAEKSRLSQWITAEINIESRIYRDSAERFE